MSHRNLYTVSAAEYRRQQQIQRTDELYRQWAVEQQDPNSDYYTSQLKLWQGMAARWIKDPATLAKLEDRTYATIQEQAQAYMAETMEWQDRLLGTSPKE